MSLWTRAQTAWSVLRGDSRTHTPPAAAASGARTGASIVRADSYHNEAVGLGIPKYDRRLQTIYRLSFDVTRNYELIRALVRTNPIARKVVWKQVELAFGTGVEWIAPDEQRRKALEAEVQRLNAELMVKRGRAYGRAYGGAVVVLLANDGRMPDERLNEDALWRIDDLYVLEREYLGRRDTGVWDGSLIEPEHYQVSLPSGSLLHVHKSRVLRNEGLDVDTRTRELLDGWGDSVLQPVWAALRDVQGGEAALAHSLIDSAEKVFKIKGLHDAIAAGNGDFATEWIASMNQFMSAFRAAGIDADNEAIEYLARPMAESVEVYLALMHVVAAAADMPLTELYGRSPAGLNATGESDTRKWYDKIEAEEHRGELDRNMRRLVRLICLQRSQPLLDPDTCSFKWPSLWSPTAQEKAELANSYALTDAVYLDRGVFSEAEIRQLRMDQLGIVPVEEPAPTAQAQPLPSEQQDAEEEGI